jgi:hypothetical protein
LPIRFTNGPAGAQHLQPAVGQGLRDEGIPVGSSGLPVADLDHLAVKFARKDFIAFHGRRRFGLEPNDYLLIH